GFIVNYLIPHVSNLPAWHSRHFFQVLSNEGWCFGTWHATAMYLSISTHSKVPGQNACYAKRANCLHVELSN
ncbi:hypothetical protein ACUN90_31895, partial [Escherichia sp. SP-MK2]